MFYYIIRKVNFKYSIESDKGLIEAYGFYLDDIKFEKFKYSSFENKNKWYLYRNLKVMYINNFHFINYIKKIIVPIIIIASYYNN